MSTRRRRSRERVREAAAFYAFSSPWIIGTAVLTLFPLGYALYLSFTNWDGLSPVQNFVGLDNYVELFQASETYTALARTLLLVAVVVPVTIVGSLALALLLNEKVRGRAIFRTLVYIPAVVPAVAASLMWKVVFDKDSGWVNRLLEVFDIDPVSWLTGNNAFVALMVVMVWALGAGVIIYLAALQNVDQEQLEAARVDGAGVLRSFRHVTLPAISPVVLFQTVLTLIATLQIFIPPLLLAPVGRTDAASAVDNVPASNRLYMVDVYAQFFESSRYGYGAAMIVVFVIVILLITVLVFRVGGRTVYYAVDPNEGRS